MAYSNTPQLMTYTTKRYDLVGEPTGRNGTTLTQDQRLVNLVPELVKDPSSKDTKYYLRERAGLIYKSSGGSAGTARGGAYFNGHNYTAIGNTLYQDGVSVKTLGNSTGHVGFTQFNGTYTALIVLDGIKGFVVKTDLTVTEITSLDFPTPHIPNPIYIDGYLFVGKSGTDDIYNSNLEDPLTWTPGDFITAELYPDNLVGLAKNNNYLYALGSNTIEYFYDNAVATGSPLQRNDSAVQQFGLVATETLVDVDREVIFAGTTDDGGRTIWSIVGFEPTEIATPVIRQSLDAEGTSITSAKAFMVRVMGHKFYVLNLSTRTWVYDFDEKMWHEWSFTNDTTPFLCSYSWGNPDGKARLLHPTNGNILAFSDAVAYDAISDSTTVPIYCVATTDKIDNQSNNRKACSRLSMICDAPNSAADTAITVQWSDDDYKTWSAARTLYIHGDLSAITQLGMFRRRAFKFTYNAAYPLRMEGYELDINIGQN